MERPTTHHTHTLRRIVAVLLALADLAERAAGRSAAVRSPVLWLLRSGETLARDYVAALTWGVAGQPEPLRPTLDSAAEATRLAASFRQLAAILSALAVDPTASQQTRMAQSPDAAPACLPAAFATAASAVERRDSS